MNPTQTRLITGCGYLGQRVAEHWRNSGCDVVALTRSADRADDFRQQGLRPLVTNIADPADLQPLPEADVVLWAVGFDRTTGDAREDIWLDGLKRLLQRLSSPPRRFLYVSSTSVYGQNEGQTIDEMTPPQPATEGGRCCRAAEQLLQQHCTQYFPETQVVILRMAGIYGPGRLLRRVTDLQAQLPLPGEPDQWLNLIHVQDAVRMLDLASSAATVPAVINVVNSRTVTRRQYYTRLAELVSAPPPIFAAGAATTRPRGGHKRVVSRFRDELSAAYAYDDVLAGLTQAVAAE